MRFPENQAETFAINAHFPDKSYNFQISRVKFNKVAGNMIFPERSKENWMKAG